MTPEAQQKIRGMVELALSYVVEPKPLEVPTAPGTIEELVEQMAKGLTITDSKGEAQISTDEEAWDGESFGVRLAGLGKLLSNDVTKVSLACKPPAESKTVIGMIDALGETCFRLAGFVDSVPVHLTGQTYKAEIQLLSNNIFLATAALLNEFLEVPVEKVLQIQQRKSAIQASVSGLAEMPTSSASTSKTGSAAESGSDGYLMKTGIVWEACQIFEQASQSNRQAVAKKWGDMMSTMEDAIAEVQDMIDSNDEDNDGDSDAEDSGNESDDSWNADEKLTEEEKQLSIRANALLKLTKMLFKKLQQRCLDTQPTTALSESSTALRSSDLARMWDQLYNRARGIVELADEIATSLYSPQDPESIVSMLQELSRKNHDCILVGRLFVRGQAEHERWMDMCEAQTQKILGTVLVK
ncbi:hypothetical protein BGZ82_006471 [Podila clonocystis]|nr:hypothetical protein BGZ82_006471 [Podila clonocystis]